MASSNGESVSNNESRRARVDDEQLEDGVAHESSHEDRTAREGERGGNEGYALPNDTTETTRLNDQSKAIYTLLGNKHIHTPIPASATAILDIGCGTGAVTISLALRNPNTEIIGVDLSPVEAGTTPPPNCTFLEGDIFDLVDNRRDPRLSEGIADLVYSRLFVFALGGNKWADYVKVLARLAKPGTGVVECVDLEWSLYEVQDTQNQLGSLKAAKPEWIQATREAARGKGYDLDAGKNLEGYMRDAGLVDVQVRKYVWPVGRKIDELMPDLRPGQKGIGFGTKESWRHIHHAMAGFMEGDDQYTTEMVKRYQDEAMESLEGMPYAVHVLYVVTGRRP